MFIKGKKTAVIGQTGRMVLSGGKGKDGVVRYKISKRRCVRYRFQKVKHGWYAIVCGPFHSKLYGACAFAADKATIDGKRRSSASDTKKRARDALRRRLANSYGFLGNLLLSAVDDADTVGIPQL